MGDTFQCLNRKAAAGRGGRAGGRQAGEGKSLNQRSRWLRHNVEPLFQMSFMPVSSVVSTQSLFFCAVQKRSFILCMVCFDFEIFVCNKVND